MERPRGKKKDAESGFRNPHNLPVKVCPSCGRPFVWRKKWERDWPNVLYCSDACRTQVKRPDSP